MPEPLMTKDHWLNPVWTLRGMQIASALLILLAMILHSHESVHDACVGGALGLLIGGIVMSFDVGMIELKRRKQPSDVQRYPLT